MFVIYTYFLQLVSVVFSIRGACICRQPVWFHDEEETNSTNIGDTIDSDIVMEDDEIENSTRPCKCSNYK